MGSVCVVIPAYNEEESLQAFLPDIIDHLGKVDPDGRVLVVDDGSKDGTVGVLTRLEEEYPQLSHISLGRNLGKARALQQGFQSCVDNGVEVVVMMDADGQDDPGSIQALVEHLDAGFDLVTGSRIEDRQDRFVKKYTSRLYNGATSLIGGAPGRDHNSGFKAIRRTVASDLVPMMYGELHRYITVIAYWHGYRVSELPVPHHARQFGSSKYGLARFWRGFLDLVTVRFLLGYESRPLHLFGPLGAFSSLIGTVILAYLFVLRVSGEPIGTRPLLQAGVLLVLAGLQLVIFGLVAELIVFSSNRSAALGRHDRK